MTVKHMQEKKQACPLRAGLRVVCVALAVAAVGATRAVRADELRAGTTTHHGAFVGVEDGKILFQTDSGKLLKEPRTSVRGLKLDKACPVTVQETTSRQDEEYMLTGYERGRFTFEQSGKETSIPGMRIGRITVARSTPAGGGPTRSGAPGAIRSIDTAALRNNPGLTAPQLSALDRYETARSRYESFLEESSAMVAEMDKATGGRREALLNTLRQRKIEEQPVRRELEKAQKALINAFANHESSAE